MRESARLSSVRVGTFICFEGLAHRLLELLLPPQRALHGLHEVRVRHQLGGDLGEDLLAPRPQPVEETSVDRHGWAPFGRAPSRAPGHDEAYARGRDGGNVLQRGLNVRRSSRSPSSRRNSRRPHRGHLAARLDTRSRRSRSPTAARAGRSRPGRAPARTPARTCCAGTACGRRRRCRAGGWAGPGGARRCPRRGSAGPTRRRRRRSCPASRGRRPASARRAARRSAFTRGRVRLRVRVGSARRTLTPSSSSVMRQISSERMRLSVARWIAGADGLGRRERGEDARRHAVHRARG